MTLKQTLKAIHKIDKLMMKAKNDCDKAYINLSMYNFKIKQMVRVRDI